MLVHYQSRGGFSLYASQATSTMAPIEWAKLFHAFICVATKTHDPETWELVSVDSVLDGAVQTESDRWP